MNILNVKTNKGIDKYNLYENLSEVVGKKIKKIKKTNEKKISIENDIAYSIPLLENEDAIILNKSTCTVKVYSKINFDLINPIEINLEKKFIKINFIPVLLLNDESALLLKDVDFPFYAGKIHLSLKFEDDISILKTNEKEINENIFGNCVYLKDDIFSNFLIEDEEFSKIYNCYFNKYKDSWQKKIEEDIKNTIECFYQEDNVDLKYNIKDRVLNFLVEDIWLNDYIDKNDLKLDYEISYFDFNPEGDVRLACIKKENVNAVYNLQDLEKVIEFKNINSKTVLSDYYILQTLNSYEYLFFKNRIDGDVINIFDNYILKTAGKDNNFFSFNKEKILTLEQEIDNFNITSIYNKFPYKKGMYIIVTGGQGEYGQGEYGYKGEDGQVIKYELPNILNSRCLISLKVNGKGKKGEKGKDIVLQAKTALSEEYADFELRGRDGGEGGDSIKLTIDFGDLIDKEIAEGGKGGEGENYFSHVENTNKTIEEKWKADFVIYS